MIDVENNTLTESEQRYRQRVKGLPAAFYACDAQGRITLYNDAAENLWGRKPEIGKDLWCGSWRIYRTDGTPLPLNECPMAVALTEGRSVHGQEIVIERPDGVRRNVMPHPQPIFDSTGTVVEAVNMLVDITDNKRAEKALRESEDRFRTLADQAPIMIWMSDEKGNITYLNSKWVDFTGKTAKECYGTGWTNYLHPEDKELAYDQWMKAFHERIQYDIKFRYLNAKGEYSYLKATGSPRYNSSEEFVGYIGVLHDITMQEISTATLEKEVEERTKELKKAIHDLAKSNSELEQFAYVASHDLQEPLRKIQTFAEMLEKNLHDLNKCKNFVGRISDSSNRSMTLINELLNFSKLSKSGEACVDVNLDEILQDIKGDFELTINEKKAKIDHGFLPTVEGIPLQIHQLFYNIISNSLKFSRKNVKPVITVMCSKMSAVEISDHPGLNPGIGYYHISFKDNGIGFNQEYAEQIFTIFQRLHDRQSYTGTGIGLALCKKIVVNHHGQIYAFSEENNGATFHVILPETQTFNQSWRVVQ